MLRCEHPCRTGEAWLLEVRLYAIVATSGFRNTVYGLAPGIGCAGQWLANLKATNGGDEEEHEQHSQKQHVDEHADHAALVLVLDPHDIANRIRRSHEQPKHREFLAHSQTAQLVADATLHFLENKAIYKILL